MIRYTRSLSMTLVFVFTLQATTTSHAASVPCCINAKSALLHFFVLPFAWTAGSTIFGTALGFILAGNAGSTRDRDECTRLNECLVANPNTCSVYYAAESAYATLNSTSVKALASLADMSHQQSLRVQLSLLGGRCNWYKLACHFPDPDGVHACERVGDAATNTAFAGQWIGAIVGATLGYSLGGMVHYFKYARVMTERAGYTPVADSSTNA